MNYKLHPAPTFETTTEVPYRADAVEAQLSHAKVRIIALEALDKERAFALQKARIELASLKGKLTEKKFSISKRAQIIAFITVISACLIALRVASGGVMYSDIGFGIFFWALVVGPIGFME